MGTQSYLTGLELLLKCLPPEDVLGKRAPTAKRIIFNNPATVVFWADGTKTVVKTMEGDKFDEYAGFAAALCKKIYGNNSKVKHMIDTLAVRQ